MHAQNLKTLTLEQKIVKLKFKQLVRFELANLYRVRMSNNNDSEISLKGRYYSSRAFREVRTKN